MGFFKKNKEMLITVLVVALLVGGFYFIYNKSQPEGGVTNYYAGNNINVPTPTTLQTQSASYVNSLWFDQGTICLGTAATGHIDTNIPNGKCSIFIKNNNVWQLYTSADLNAAGDFSDSYVVNAMGTASFKAICCDSNTNCKMSNEATLTVNACAQQPPQQTQTQYWCCTAMGVNSCYQNACPSAGVKFYPDSFTTAQQCNIGCPPAAQPPSPSAYVCCNVNGQNGCYEGGCPQGATQNGGAYEIAQQCMQHCSNVPPAQTGCVDSDYGANAWTTSGTCTFNGEFISDTCQDGTHLLEYACEPLSNPTGCGYVTVNCPGVLPGSVCLNGRCMNLV